MTKIIYALLLTLPILIGKSQAQGNSIESFERTYVDTCTGDGTNMWVYYTATTETYDASEYIKVYFGDGSSSDMTYYETNYAVDHLYATNGTYTITAVLYDDDDEAIDSFTITDLVHCRFFEFYEFMDDDNDCALDIGESTVNTGTEIEVRKDGVVIDLFPLHSYSTYYLSDPDVDATYSFYLTTPLSGGISTSCVGTDGEIISFELEDISDDENTFYIGYSCDESYLGFDFKASMSGFMRYIETSFLNINGINYSCNSTSADVVLEINPKYELSYVTLPGSTVSGNTVTWTGVPLSLIDNFQSMVFLTPATTLTVGDTVLHTLTINPISGDENPTNNVFEFVDTIRASYDPNNKLVNPSGIFAAGQRMTYTINFENLGSDSAWNIHILDVLDENLDKASFELVASSHNCYYNIFEDADGNNLLRIDFPNIRLPHIDHPDANKGFIIYQINALDGLTPGATIENTADIFFDINPPITTNTTWNEIPNPSSVEELAINDGINVYPNPSNGIVYVDNVHGRFQKAIIVNQLGQVISLQNLDAGVNNIEIKNASSGLYYILFQNDTELKSTKISITR